MEKKVEIFIFLCGFKKCVLVKCGAIVFRLRPLAPPIGAVRTGKTEKTLKILFFVAVSKRFLRRKRSDFRDHFRFLPLVPPARGAH